MKNIFLLYYIVTFSLISCCKPAAPAIGIYVSYPNLEGDTDLWVIPLEGETPLDTLNVPLTELNQYSTFIDISDTKENYILTIPNSNYYDKITDFTPTIKSFNCKMTVDLSYKLNGVHRTDASLTFE